MVQEKWMYVADDGAAFESKETAENHEAFTRFRQLIEDALPNATVNKEEVFETLWRHRDHIVSALKNASTPTDAERMSS